MLIIGLIVSLATLFRYIGNTDYYNKGLTAGDHQRHRST